MSELKSLTEGDEVVMEGNRGINDVSRVKKVTARNIVVGYRGEELKFKKSDGSRICDDEGDKTQLRAAKADDRKKYRLPKVKAQVSASLRSLQSKLSSMDEKTLHKLLFHLNKFNQ